MLVAQVGAEMSGDEGTEPSYTMTAEEMRQQRHREEQAEREEQR